MAFSLFPLLIISFLFGSTISIEDFVAPPETDTISFVVRDEDVEGVNRVSLEFRRPNASLKSRLDVELLRVGRLPVKANMTGIKTKSGKIIYVTGAPPNLTMEVQRWSIAPDEVLRALLPPFFTGKKTFSHIRIEGNDATWTDEAYSFVQKGGFRAEGLTLGYPGDRDLRENKILDIVKAVKPIGLVLQPIGSISLSDKFFQDPAITKLQAFYTTYHTKNDITEETLVKWKAATVGLGSTTQLTHDSLRRFFKPVLDGDVETRELDLVDSVGGFEFDEKVFLIGYKVQKLPGTKVSDDYIRFTWRIYGKKKTLTLHHVIIHQKNHKLRIEPEKLAAPRKV